MRISSFLLVIALAVVTTTFAQTTPTFQKDVEDLVVQANNTIVYSAKTITLADSIIKVVNEDNNDALIASIIDGYNTSFIGVDVYFGKSTEEVLNDIVGNQGEATFTDFDVRKASVVVRTNGEIYMAVIASQF